MTTETEHLIRQAAHEIGISLDQTIDITADTEAPGTYVASFKNRKGEDAKVSITMDAGFKRIHDQLKAAWKGKA